VAIGLRGGLLGVAIDPTNGGTELELELLVFGAAIVPVNGGKEFSGSGKV
jgi:hypothetical protein